MARNAISIGLNPDDGTGEDLRSAMDKINDNFIELYVATGGGNLSGIDLDGSTIKTTNTNANLILDPNGTGITQVVGNLEVTGSITGAVQLTIVDDTSTASTIGTSDTLAIRGGAGITTSISGDTITITNSSPNTTQNVFTAFNSDSGSISSTTPTDSLSVVGSGITNTSIVGNVLTISTTETDTLDTVLSRNHITNTRPFFNGGIQVETLTLRQNNIQSNSSNADINLVPNGSGEVRVTSNLTVIGDINGSLSGNATTATTLANTRTFILSGAVTSSPANFDGSGNVILNAIPNTSQLVTPNTVQTLSNKTFSNATTIDGLRIVDNNIQSINSSDDIVLEPSGTGTVEILDNRFRIAEIYTPVSSVGEAGDKSGDIAFDDDYVYHCIADYDGSTLIWKRAALTTW